MDLSRRKQWAGRHGSNWSWKVGKEGRLEGLYAEEVGRLRSWNLKDRNGKRNVGVNAFRFVDTWHFAVAITYQKS